MLIIKLQVAGADFVAVTGDVEVVDSGAAEEGEEEIGATEAGAAIAEDSNANLEAPEGEAGVAQWPSGRSSMNDLPHFFFVYFRCYCCFSA